VLLTKYSHEKTYRLRESIEVAAKEDASTTAAIQEPLPEFEPINSAITEAPNSAM
jgi:hypothetical protein